MLLKRDQRSDSTLMQHIIHSHGTSEFYRARAAITQHLITHHGFNVVAIEADWPDAKAVDRYVRHSPSKSTTPSIKNKGVFDHFPRWMWRNTEVQSFAHWLRRHNAALPPEQRVRFAGLDLYSMGASIRLVQDYLDRHADPQTAALARRRYACLEPWTDDPAAYGRNAFLAGGGAAPCEKGVVHMLRDMLKNRLDMLAAARDDDGEDDFFDAEMNARLVRDAEEYYRAMFYGGGDASWNLRDSHFFGTLARLLQHEQQHRQKQRRKSGGPPAKAIVWAHNSHVGDARFTAMGESRNQLNLGQLCKERWGAGCSIVGCGTHAGTVAAAHEWDGPMEVVAVRPSRGDSYERLMHDAGVPSFMLDLREGVMDRELRKELMKERLERFIGVIYWPDTERWSHYSKAVLPRQMDCLVWFDWTEAVHAFETAQPDEQPSAGETYPFGL
ncbi:hypothetical protein SLS54_003058 [Diplodia seriata]